MLIRTSWISLLVVIGLTIAAGCKKWPNESSTPQAITLQGTYVGAAQVQNAPVNVLLEITGPDTAGHYSGRIRLYHQIISLDTVTATSDLDTVWFNFSVGDASPVQYQAYALDVTNNLVVQFTAPAGIPSFHMNKESLGANLTGYWTGFMTGSALPDSRSAIMSMDQQGLFFIGTVDVTFFETDHFVINHGQQNTPAIQFDGSMHVGTAYYSALFYGNFLTSDSISGNWQAGQNGSQDFGQFVFHRIY
jgi:hypothetical protein